MTALLCIVRGTIFRIITCGYFTDLCTYNLLVLQKFPCCATVIRAHVTSRGKAQSKCKIITLVILQNCINITVNLLAASPLGFWNNQRGNFPWKIPPRFYTDSSKGWDRQDFQLLVCIAWLQYRQSIKLTAMYVVPYHIIESQCLI